MCDCEPHNIYHLTDTKYLQVVGCAKTKRQKNVKPERDTVEYIVYTDCNCAERCLPRVGNDLNGRIPMIHSYVYHVQMCKSDYSWWHYIVDIKCQVHFSVSRPAARLCFKASMPYICVSIASLKRIFYQLDI